MRVGSPCTSTNNEISAPPPFARPPRDRRSWKGQYLGFREVVRGDDFEKYEMKLAENNMMFNMVSVDAGLIFEKKADIDQLKAALKAIIPKFSKAAGRMVLRDKKIFVICNN